MKIDETGMVAHYSKLSNLANILHDGRVRLGAVADMADPREASLEWIQTMGYGHECSYADQKKAERLKTQFGQQLRLFCTARPQTAKESHPSDCPLESATYGRPRMWAQYAGDTTGFCILLDREKFHAEILKHASRPEYLISGDVDYFPGLHYVGGGQEIPHGVEWSDEQLFKHMNDNFMLHSVYLKKSVDWMHEREFRWLLFNEAGEPVFVSIQGSIKAVVLGWKFPENQVSQAKMYCDKLGCECWAIEYWHSNFELTSLKSNTDER